MSIDYREYAPAAALRDTVQCYWTSRSPTPVLEPHLTRVLPDGCIDILFDLGDAAVRDSPDLPRSYVVGAMQEPLVVWLTGSVDIVGVRFSPGGATRFLETRASELTGRTVPLEYLWGRAAGLVEEKLAEGGRTPADRIEALDELLLGRQPIADAGDAAVLEASRLIAASAGTVPVRAICEHLRMHPRQLERRFEERVGLAPKVACRVARFQRAVALALAEPHAALSRIALSAGFYDQAHLTREFTALSGLPPAAWLSERRRVASVQDMPTHRV